MEKPLKLLARSWVQGKGCVHHRSAAMPEEEARKLMKAGIAAIEKAQESGRIEEIPLPSGRAFVKARRTPDPDEPGRTAPGFILVSIPDPDAFIHEVIARDWDELLRAAAEATLDRTTAPAEGDLGRQAWKAIDLGRSPGVSKEKGRSRSWRRRELERIALIVSIVALFLLARRGWQGSPGRGDHARIESEATDESSGLDESNWTQIREQIRQTLEADWARNLMPHKSPLDDTNRDLLRRFAGLFQRPDLKSELAPKDFKHYEAQESSDHPFVAFLGRLPREIPAPKDSKADPTPREAMAYMKELDGKLKECGPSPIELRLDRPKTLAEQARNGLDYIAFFKQRLRTIPTDAPSREHWQSDDPLDQSGAVDTAYHWVGTVRKLIKDRYSWH